MKKLLFIIFLAFLVSVSAGQNLNAINIKFGGKMPNLPQDYRTFYVTAFSGTDVCKTQVLVQPNAQEISPSFTACNIQKSPAVIIEISNPAIFGKKRFRLGESVASSAAGIKRTFTQKVPDPPVITASVSGSSVRIAWFEPANGGLPITRYDIYRSNSPNAQARIASVTAVSYTDSSVQTGTSYFYRIKAVNAKGESSFSNEIPVSLRATTTCYANKDNDMYGTGQQLTMEQCTAGFAAVPGDCNDNDASVWRYSSAYIDSDKDGYGTGSLLSVCMGTSLPAGYALISGDCNDNDKNSWSLGSSLYSDGDRDGYGTGSASAVCTGTSTPQGYSTVSGDCNDNDASVWRLASLYKDADSDGYGIGAASSRCIGAAAPAGFSTAPGDCYDSNANAKPGQTSYFSVQRGDNSFDYDCNGQVSKASSAGGLSVIASYDLSVARDESCTNQLGTDTIGGLESLAGCGQSTGAYVCDIYNSYNDCSGSLYRTGTIGSECYGGYVEVGNMNYLRMIKWRNIGPVSITCK